MCDCWQYRDQRCEPEDMTVVGCFLTDSFIVFFKNHHLCTPLFFSVGFAFKYKLITRFICPVLSAQN